MSRRKTGNAVSLFPFLAVLVSAMGALILLLLVVTRKLHNDAVAKAKAEQMLVQSQKDAEAEAARNKIPLPLPEDHPAFQTDAAEFVIAIKSPAKQLLPPSPPPAPDRTLEKEKLRREWESRLAEMRDNWERLQQRLRTCQSLVSTKAQQEADLAAELARLQEAIDKLRAEKGEIKQEVASVKTTKQTIAQQIAELQAELERLKAEKSEQANKFQLVPYAGSSPTHRRPIIIECEANTIRFASEEIAVSAQDMSGFSSEYNPARAGTEALLNYFEAQRHASSSLAAMPSEPYLLFVIRPGGTVSYYVTRKMLEGLKVDSGYELVTQSQELVWPASTPEAKAACQAAINEVLGARDRLTAKAPHGGVHIDDEMNYSGANGEFILDEVQKLRNPEKKTFVGGQRITRQERPRGGYPGYKPPTAPEKDGFVGPRLGNAVNDEWPVSKPRSAREEHAASQPGRGRPFPTEPPPRFGSGRLGSGSGASSKDDTAPGSAGPEGSDAVAMGDANNSPVGDSPGGGSPRDSSKAPVQKLKPGWQSGHPGVAVDPQNMIAMTPEERAQHTGVPSKTAGPVGNYKDAGRGAGHSSGEATSQQGDQSQVGDLLSSTTGKASPKRLEPRPPTNEPLPESNGGGQPAPQPGGNSHGDRTSVAEATTDPSQAGEWKAHGAAGGKGTATGNGGGGSLAPPLSIHIPAGGPGKSGDPNSQRGRKQHPAANPLASGPPDSITAERYVIVTIDSSHVEVGNHQIPIELGDSDLELQTQFSKELAALTKRWGRPPAGFHWQPAVRFRVRPGGNQYYAWLHSASQEWGMRNQVEYVFD